MNNSVPLTLFLTDGYGNSAWDGYVAATSLTSNPIDISFYRGYSINFTCPATGSPVGSVQLQVSADGTNFFNSGSSQAVSNATITYWDVPASAAKSFRLLYTRVSGTITVSAKATLK